MRGEAGLQFHRFYNKRERHFLCPERRIVGIRKFIFMGKGIGVRFLNKFFHLKAGTSQGIDPAGHLMVMNGDRISALDIGKRIFIKI